MAQYSFSALGKDHLTISGGGDLDGVTQGDGSHLVGLTITIDAYNFETITVNDSGSDEDFDDNDGNQRIDGDTDFDGVTYSDTTRIEAEYLIVLEDAEGNTYTAVGVNFDNSSPRFGTVEGLAFVDEVPPLGVALTVVSASEGPGSSGQPALPNTDIATPPCFTAGTLIATPGGDRAVETLRPGDLVTTVDGTARALRWIGQSPVSVLRQRLMPAFRPIRIRAHAFGPGRPARDTLVSPQHRILLRGWEAELHFGEPEILAAALHLVDGVRITIEPPHRAITYIHLQFDRHEIVLGDGLSSESFNPGPAALAAIPGASRRELAALFPGRDLGTAPPLTAARPMVRRHEAALMVRRVA